MACSFDDGFGRAQIAPALRAAGLFGSHPGELVIALAAVGLVAVPNTV